jgi:hypothetical protein
MGDATLKVEPEAYTPAGAVDRMVAILVGSVVPVPANSNTIPSIT